MSDPEKFLARWSRRKREAVEDGEQTKSPAPAPAQDADATADARAGEDRGKREDVQAAPTGAAAPTEPAFDLSSLPPLESITAESDIRAFLAPGVPPDMTRAALRRAWSADPKIRDFVGLAEYAWDYHEPGSMAGFGPLEMTDELRRLVARMVGGEVGEEGTERSSPTAAAASGPQTSIESTETVASPTSQPTDAEKARPATAQNDPATDSEARRSGERAGADKAHIAMQHNAQEPDASEPIVRRPHGRALPK